MSMSMHGRCGVRDVRARAHVWSRSRRIGSEFSTWITTCWCPSHVSLNASEKRPCRQSHPCKRAERREQHARSGGVRDGGCESSLCVEVGWLVGRIGRASLGRAQSQHTIARLQEWSSVSLSFEHLSGIGTVDEDERGGVETMEVCRDRVDLERLQCERRGGTECELSRAQGLLEIEIETQDWIAGQEKGPPSLGQPVTLRACLVCVACMCRVRFCSGSLLRDQR